MMNFGGKLPIFAIFCQFLENQPMFKENLPNKGPFLEKFRPKTHPYGWHIPVPSTCYVTPPPQDCGIQQLGYKSYFSNRKQFSRAYDLDSSIEGINAGVPQGSCLLDLFNSSFTSMTSHELSEIQMYPCMLMTRALAISRDISLS